MRFLLFIFLSVFSFAATGTDYKFVAHYNDGTCGGNCNTYCANLYPVDSTWENGVYFSYGVVLSTGNWDYNPTQTGLSNDIYCKVTVQETTPPEPIDCNVTNSSWDSSTESCKCDTNYIPTYDLNGLASCDLPQCPYTYNNGMTILPLFAEVPNATLCNAFPFSDSAIATLVLNVKYCCYGQESIDDDSICGPDEMQIGTNCYPMQTTDSNDTDRSCSIGSTWSESAGQCLPDNLYTADFNGTMGSYDGNGSTPIPTASESSLFEDTINIDGVKEELNKLVNSYVLIKMPISASGTCSNETVKIFSFLGHSFRVDVGKYLGFFNDHLAVIRALILFSFAVSGLLLVFSGRGN